jgi:hypothetical protein
MCKDPHPNLESRITAGKGNLRFRHGSSPLLLVSLPYLEGQGMSSEKHKEAKKSHDRDAEAVVDNSDCRDQSEKLCRQLASHASRGRVDQTAKPTDTRCANIRKTDKRMG